MHTQYILELYSMLYLNLLKIKTVAHFLSKGKDRAKVMLQKDRKRNVAALGALVKVELTPNVIGCNQGQNLAICFESVLSIKVCQK